MAARNPFGHIDLRVRSVAEALPFYEVLLPELGFVERYDGPAWKAFVGAGEPPGTAYFAFTESPDHVPNENRIAFWVHEPAEVDRIAVLLEDAGAGEIVGPKRMPYGPD